MRYITRGKYTDLPGTMTKANYGVRSKFVTVCRSTPEPDGIPTDDTTAGEDYHVDREYDDGEGNTFLFLRFMGWVRRAQFGVTLFARKETP